MALQTPTAIHAASGGKTMGYTVTKRGFGIKTGTSRIILAQWEWLYGNKSKQQVNGASYLWYTEKFKVEWFYTESYVNNKPVWKLIDELEIARLYNSDGSYQTVYEDECSDVPETAIQVKVRITPISLVNPDTEVPYYSDWACTSDADWTINITPDAELPPTPPAPTLSVDGAKITATVDMSDVEYDSNNEPLIYIELYKEDEPDVYQYSGNKSMWFTHTVSHDWPSVDTGTSYVARACCKYKNGVSGLWSEYCKPVETMPDAPIITEIITTGDSTIQVYITKANKVEQYRLEAISRENEAVKNYVYHNNNISKRLTELFEHTNIPKETVTISEDEWSNKTLYGDTNIVYGWTLGNSIYGEYYIRAVAVNKDGEPSKGSETRIITVGDHQDKSSKYMFAIGTEPTAPTTWSSSSTVVIGEPLNLYWLHNSADNSKVTKSVLHIICNNDEKSEASYTIGSDAQTIVDSYNGLTITVPAFDRDEESVRYVSIDTSDLFDGTTITWKVQTAGYKKDKDTGELVYSEYSTERTVEVYNRPNVDLSILGLLGGYLRSFPLHFIAEVGPATNQYPTSYHVKISVDNNGEGYYTMNNAGEAVYISDQQVIFSKHYDTTDFDIDYNITAGEIDLANNVTYKVVVTVGMSSGLTLEDEKYFTVGWSEDLSKLIPGCSVGFNRDDYSASIQVFLNDKDTTINQNDYTLSVYRREFNGDFVEIGSGLRNGSYIDDPHPTLNYARYRVVAQQKSTGAMAFADTDNLYFGVKSIVIQWNEPWQSFELFNATPKFGDSMVVLPYNIKIDDSFSKDATLVSYIGRERPVSYYGTIKSHTSTWSTEIPKTDEETLYAIRRLAEWMGDVYVREPSGTGYWANITVKYSKTYSELTIPISFEITRVEGGK